MTKRPAPQRRWFLFWLVVFGGVFAVGETIAVANPSKGDTLSESVAWLVSLAPWWSGEIVLAGFLAALAWHFTFGKGTRWPGQ